MARAERGERDWDVVDLRVLRPTTASNEGMQGTPCHRAQELCESGGGRPGLPVHNSPYVLCGRKVILKLQSSGAV